MAIDPNPSFVTAELSFSTIPSSEERAFININADSTTGKRKSNYDLVPTSVKIENLREKEDAASYTLDTAGFQFFSGRPSAHKSFVTDEEIKKEYYPESAEYIKQITGASRVVFFDHTIRRRRPGEFDDTPQKRQPVINAHIDQTPKSALVRVHRHLPAEEVPELLKHRYQLINLWRPINHAALDLPLALCDFRSVDEEKDVMPVALLYPDGFEGETYSVHHNPNQRWKYLKGMTPDDFVLIKCFDSIQDGSVAKFTPHTAFKDPSTPPDAPLRESIELRALVFYDN